MRNDKMLRQHNQPPTGRPPSMFLKQLCLILTTNITFDFQFNHNNNNKKILVNLTRTIFIITSFKIILFL